MFARTRWPARIAGMAQNAWYPAELDENGCLSVKVDDQGVHLALLAADLQTGRIEASEWPRQRASRGVLGGAWIAVCPGGHHLPGVDREAPTCWCRSCEKRYDLDP